MGREQDPVDAVLDAMRDKRNEREALLDSIHQVPDYAWCEIRGDIHSTIVGDRNTELRHNGTVYYDLYQDGELCSDADHKPVFTTGEID